MNCPKCKCKVLVKDMRHTERNEIYRRRQCPECNYIFYTSEHMVHPDEEYFKAWSKNYRKVKRNEQ